MTTIASTYADRTKTDKLSLVRQQVEEVKETIKNSINLAIANTEKMDALEVKANELADKSKIFHKSATDLHRQMRLRQLKLMLCIGFVVILAIIIVLYLMGVFSVSVTTTAKPVSAPKRVRSI